LKGSRTDIAIKDEPDDRIQEEPLDETLTAGSANFTQNIGHGFESGQQPQTSDAHLKVHQPSQE
jgi:hypothetical protein